MKMSHETGDSPRNYFILIKKYSCSLEKDLTLKIFKGNKIKIVVGNDVRKMVCI